SFHDRTHVMQSTAYRMRIEMSDLVCRAGFEAEHEVGAELEPGRVEGRAHAGIRPGASTPRGSKRSFSARAMPSGTRGAPHAPPASRLYSALARSSTAIPPAASSEVRTFPKVARSIDRRR